MTDHEADRTTAPEGPEANVDELARRAGASLRATPPPDGADRIMAVGRTIRRRRTLVAAGGTAVILLGAVVLMTRRDPATSTVDEPAVESTAPPVPLSTTTVAAGPTAGDLTQWALDYTGGGGGEPSGAPIRIGIGQTSTGLGAISAVAELAADYVNEELGGVHGRPLELSVCTFGTFEQNRACAEALAADPEVAVVISPVEPSFTAGLGDLPSLTALTARPEATNGERAYHPSLGAELRAAAGAVGRLVERPRPKVLVAASIGGEPYVAPVEAVLPDAEVIPIATAANGDRFAQLLRDRNATDADAIILLAPPSDVGCQAIADGITELQIDPVVVTVFCKPEFEGFYYVDPWVNPDAPNLETGEATALAELEERGYRFDPVADPGGFRIGDFAYVLTAVKILNGLPESDLDRATIGEALESFTGPAMLWGPQDCSQRSVVSAGLSCATEVNVYRTVNGRLVSIDPIPVSPSGE